MDNRFFLKTTLLLLTLLLSACQSGTVIKVFNDKTLRTTQYAKLEAPTGILILEIDGVELAYASQYHILPGKRKMHVMVSAFKEDKAYKVGDIDIEFYATAGHVYHIKSRVTAEHTYKDYTVKSNEFLWIEDTTLDSVVAGRKP